MLAKVLSSAVIGIEAYLVEVEVDITPGLPAFTTVGLPEAAVKESKERVKSAINNSGYTFPDNRITVNLAPADIKKEGTGFDLPIALGILTATRMLPQKIVSQYLVLGELSLDGRVKPVRGTLPMALAARKAGYRGNHRTGRQQPGGGGGRRYRRVAAVRSAPGGQFSARHGTDYPPPHRCGGHLRSEMPL